MAFVSITRLRIRSIRFLPAFLVHVLLTLRQTRAAKGFLGGSLLADRHRAYWTMTLWTDAEAMRAYMTGGAHRRAMPRLFGWCDEASVAHWEADTLPDWPEADRRMRDEGRPSRVRHPTPDHAALAYAAPHVARPVPIRPR
ncbi:MAG: DUF3291 domain-containing protein [Sphingomonas fennica]